MRATVLGVERGGVKIQDINGVRTIPADIVINASGFDASYRTALASLPELLTATGLDAATVARSGLAVDDNGRLLSEPPDSRGLLYALGFIARANHGDMGTVNIIGSVAADIARDIRGAV